MYLAVDFGTSYTKLGCLQGGNFVNLAGSEINIPSVVTYLPSTGQLYFGRLALRLQEPGALTSRFFKLMLKRSPSFQLGPYSLPEIMEGFFAFLINEYVTPRGVAADHLVLSVPNYFGLRTRRLLIDAARAATAAEDIRLVPEPVAALLGHNMTQSDQALEGDVLCIDIGGGTTDFSFLNLSGQGREILLETQFQIGHDAFSGSEMDRGMLHNIFFPAFAMQTGAIIPDSLISEKNLDSRDRYRLNRLMQKAEAARIELGQKGYSRCDIPDFYNGQSLIHYLEPELFDTQMQPIFRRLYDFFLINVRTKAERLGLFHAGRWNLDYVLLLGGASLTRGVKEMIISLCPGVMIISPDEWEGAVVRGLCNWAEDAGSSPTVRNIYPFDFYIEKKINEAEGFRLEKIPFDTANLELDLGETYPIFTFPIHSDYNLAANPEEFRCRIYELSEGANANETSAERFLGQDILLGTEDNYEVSGDSITVCFNLAQSRLELAGCEAAIMPGKPLAEWRQELPAHQRAAASLLDSLPFIDKRLKNDFKQHLQATVDSNSYKYWEDTALYKMLYLIQLLNGK